MAQKIKILDWISPIEIASKISLNYESDWIFLHSASPKNYKNSVSIIALFKKNDFVVDDLNLLKKYLKKTSKDYENSYFGYVSYEYKNNLEKYKKTKNSPLNFNKIHLANFSLILEFNHENQTLRVFYDDEKKLEIILNFKNISKKKSEIQVESLNSNFTSKEYLNAIEKIKNHIENGDFYQTNLTRKFYGKFNISKQYEFFEIFKNLIDSNPVNYSAFLKFGEKYIISASPELFLEVKENQAISRPIKGTSPRSKDKIKDEINKKYLQNSLKEKSENLMIVDLVRNDLSKICEINSVKVDKIFNIDSYKNLHHLSSEVSGKILENKDAVDVFNALFPAGSMTGAPKIKAVEIAANLEKFNRGVYSGAIGFFKSFDEAIFNVVIRTLICEKNHFEFQVGGAITFDSDSKKELEEIFVKAKSILKILNLKENQIN